MFRRTVLATATATLAGCGLAPDPPSTTGFPETLPNAVFAFSWDRDAGVYEIDFVRGNRLTTTNTGALASVVTSDDAESTTLWVGGVPGGPSVGDDSTEPRASFPLTPGATLRVPVERRGDVRVIWTAPDGSRSRVVGQWELTEQPRTDRSTAAASGDATDTAAPTEEP
ncbi:hypothetical protein [Halobaculum marinum]|uniref:Lipoprotein n=1 Tax=Halobaculum marinum TaxID=3031996 RepID=A0ABD5WV05_9EURY|nr:hypothetical protein [Halobaculum sp. DT55]